MELILHIGMGKTGSSSIQHALAASAEVLHDQRAAYLGMWFDMVDPAFRGLERQENFFQQPPGVLREQASVFLETLKQRFEESGTRRFILSNEALSGQSEAMQAFLEPVRDEITVRAIGYVRAPATWLPSAYVQWGVCDKTNIGRVPPYETKARELARWYRGLLEWHDRIGEILEVRSYEAAGDIVADFGDAIGLSIVRPEKRILERYEDAEIILRAVFNDRYNAHVLPRLFERAVLAGTVGFPPLETRLEKHLDFSATEKIIAEQADLFDAYRARFGIDLQGFAPVRSLPDVGFLRDRLVDYLIEITMEQSRRILHLEQKMARFTEEKDPRQ